MIFGRQDIISWVDPQWSKMKLFPMVKDQTSDVANGMIISMVH